MTGGNVKLIAFFLPQFHPIPENDAWWGKGFTEWTNVTKARPLFPGHYQPHLPADMGFYDLRVRATRREQIAMAKAYGIDAFCYHYYWFSGTRLLNQPLDDMLADPASDMPFCLCWANENWTRRWDAAEQEILIEQKYLPGDDLAFIKSVAPFLSDPRYLRIGGAPLLIVYRPQKIPDAPKALQTWRDYCASIGIPKLLLCAALTHGNWNYESYGFDAGVEFPPHNLIINAKNADIAFDEPFQGLVVDYQDIASLYLSKDHQGQNIFPTVFPSWDNTARTSRRALIVLNGTPENYEYWLAKTVRQVEWKYPGEERPVFINAWNEWAEGCHLEPDRRFGRRFLEATASAKAGASTLTAFTHFGIPAEAVRSQTAPPSLRQDLKALIDAHGRPVLAQGKRRLRRFVGYVLTPFPKLKTALREFIDTRGPRPE
jgi:lipopolysaccharide biosynthesis protein